MKRYVEYLVDSFIDFRNVEHKFVIASLSQTTPDDVYLTTFDEDGCEYEVYGDCDIKKSLSIGIAICNPEDEFNELTGKAKALGKAENATPVLFASKPGVINTTMVRALMQQEANYLKQNPELYIKGYADAKKKYEQHQKDIELLQNLNEEEQQVYEFLITSSDESFNKVMYLASKDV